MDHHQTWLLVHHNGKDIDAVGIVTKMAYLYLFNRETGEPLFPIEEVPVDTISTMPRKPGLLNPIPTKPAPFARQGFKPNIIITMDSTSTQYKR